MPPKNKKLNKKDRRKLDHAKAVDKTHLNPSQVTAEGKALPARTSHYDKKTRTYKTAGQKVDENNSEVTYQWVEDKGGENVQIKRRLYKKDHAKARYEDEWVNECGNHCKINKDKFDSRYDDIFGERRMGAAAGKFKKFKKTY